MIKNRPELDNKIKHILKSVANKLRGLYLSEKYGNVIIPFCILRRFDCMLEEKNEEIKKALEVFAKLESKQKEAAIMKRCGVPFYNSKCITFSDLLGDIKNIKINFVEYIKAFSENVQDILDNLDFQKEVKNLSKGNHLLEMIREFADIDFSLTSVDQHSMGYIFEEIIREYKANAEAGDHYTPREIVDLCIDLILAEHAEVFGKKDKIIEVYDGCCGTGGMLFTAKQRARERLGKSDDEVVLFGQDVNPDAYAICKAEMLIRGEDPSNIKLGSTLSEDFWFDDMRKFDICITNPPFGVEWKIDQEHVKREAEEQLDPRTRFKPKLPRINDGQLLFMQNMLHKLKDDGRMAIIHNGSPLFSGDAEGGESEVRRYILENDLLEAIIALPEQMFYNTGIATYIWILSKNKSTKRKGFVQLINANLTKEDNFVGNGQGLFWTDLKPKSLGNKRREIKETHKSDIITIYQQNKENDFCRIFPNAFFFYHKVFVEQPMLDDKGNLQYDRKGNLIIDKKKADVENISYRAVSKDGSFVSVDIDSYLQTEVAPFVPNYTYDTAKTKVGVEIPFTRYFYKYTPPKKSDDLLVDIKALEAKIAQSMGSIIGGGDGK